MAFVKINEENYVNRGVTGLPDQPALPTLEMQKKFDELSIDVIIPKFNELSKELDAEIEANKMSVVSNALVEIGLEGYTTVNASVHMVKLSKNIANITINYKIVSNTKDSSKYVFIDMEKLKLALGISSLMFESVGTMVVFQPIVAYSEGTMAEFTSYADENHRGYTGLLFTQNGSLARVHEDSGKISPWPLSSPMFTPATLGTIIINGAIIIGGATNYAATVLGESKLGTTTV